MGTSFPGSGWIRLIDDKVFVARCTSLPKALDVLPQILCEQRRQKGIGNVKCERGEPEAFWVRVEYLDQGLVFGHIEGIWRSS